MTLKQVINVGGGGDLVVNDDDGGTTGANATWLNIRLASAVALLTPIKTGELGFFYSDCLALAGFLKASGVASLTAAAYKGGAWGISALAGDAVLYQTGSTALVPNLTAGDGPFYLAGRMKVGAAVAADGNMGIGYASAAGDLVELGVRNGDYAISIQKSGSPLERITSTVPLDSHWHDFEAWAPGDGNYYFSVDNETPVQLVPANRPTALLYGILRATGGAAATVDAFFDKVLWAFPQAD